MNENENIIISRKLYFVLLAVLVLVIIEICFFAYRLYFQKKFPLTFGPVNVSEVQKDMTEEEMLEKVRKLAILPEERPTFARVTSAEALKGREIFENAREGDMVLVFAEAQKVVIYRPSTGQIVEMAKIRVGGSDDILEDSQSTTLDSADENDDPETTPSVTPDLTPSL